MTSAKIQCPNCHRKYNVTDQHIGRKVTCANETCGAKFVAEVFLPTKSSNESASREPTIDAAVTNARSKPTPPPLPKPVVPARPRSILASPVVLIGLLFVVSTSGFVLLIVINQVRNGMSLNQKTATIDSEGTSPQNNFKELLYRTDMTLRLLLISNDAEVAREYIDKWTLLRGKIEKSDATELKLEVIEGHLNLIHKTIFERRDRKNALFASSNDRTIDWYDTKHSVETIRTAQRQLMKHLKLPWKDAQGSSRYSSTLAKLRDEGRRIASTSKVDSHNLPQSMTVEEARELLRRLDILYAEVPLHTGPSSFLNIRGDEYSIPSGIELSADSTNAYQIHSATARVIISRTMVPVSQQTLEKKTDTMEFIDNYRSDLDYLVRIVR